jgi:TonB family protein
MGKERIRTSGSTAWKYPLLGACIFAIVASFPLLATKAKAPVGMDAKRIRAHVKYLSSDALEGRGMGQKGSEAAADYIGKQLESYGLKPAGDDGTYFQKVPMVGVKTLSQTTFEVQRTGGESFVLKNLDDFVTNNESQMEAADFSAPIVFVGFGIKAPEYNWDDYKDFDLRGKVALLFVAEPASDDPKFFRGKALTYYGRWTYKYEETARRGAIATLIIHRSDLASYGWEVVRNSMGTERSYLKRDGTSKLEAASWVQLEIAKKIVAAGGYDLDQLYQQAQSRDFRPIELPVELKAHVASELHSFDSRNVVAKIAGRDAKQRDEAVLFTAHYDHLGINPAMKGDNIYNGAVDNATGCGMVMEIARVAAANAASGAHVPQRSILFSLVTAEEQGLLGSEFFGKHPPIPTGKISVDLNFDALPPIGEPESVEVSGAERTNFYWAVQALAKEANLQIESDARPEAGHYYRSDHFSLARVGVPAFSISEGMKFKGHDEPWGRTQAQDYVKNHYHQPSDEFERSWNFKGLAKMADFGYALGFSAANQWTLVEWNSTDEFESARRASFAKVLGPNHVFDKYPDLHLIEFEPVHYPPLGRQTRISGTVKIYFSVDVSGAVVDAGIISGHPILAEPVLASLRVWKFKPLENGQMSGAIDFEFTLRDAANGGAAEEVTFDSPGVIRIVSTPPNQYPELPSRRELVRSRNKFY